MMNTWTKYTFLPKFGLTSRFGRELSLKKLRRRLLKLQNDSAILKNSENKFKSPRSKKEKNKKEQCWKKSKL
jgi:hypothetical protein